MSENNEDLEAKADKLARDLVDKAVDNPSNEALIAAIMAARTANTLKKK